MSVLTLITDLPNLHFYCDNCGVTPANVQVAPAESKPLDNQSAFAENISGQLVSIQECLYKLTDAITKTPVWPTVNESVNTLKRRRVDDESAVDSAVSHTPQRSAQKTNSVVIGSAVENSDLQVVEPRKLLVASLFHPSTESDNLAVFLKTKLKIASDSTVVRVHKLVPAGKDLSTLDYVSFKVDVPGNLFNELLSPSMWPKGIRVREFEHRPRKPRSDAVFLPPIIAAIPGASTPAM